MSTENEEIKEKLVQGATISERKVSLIFLEILVQGLEVDKPRIKGMLNELTKQITDSRKSKNRVRVLWYIDKGEKTYEEKKQWLLDNTNSKYHIFTPDNHSVDKNYVKTHLDKLQNFHKMWTDIIACGIVKTKRNPKFQESESQKIEEVKTSMKVVE